MNICWLFDLNKNIYCIFNTVTNNNSLKNMGDFVLFIDNMFVLKNNSVVNVV